MEQFLIERLQNFTLDRKVLSVDTNDRDILRWPNANEFEVSLPQTYCNVESIRLLNVQIPNKLYNISEHLQNNKMIIKRAGLSVVITLEDGYYTNEYLATSLQQHIRLDHHKFNVVNSDPQPFDISVNFNSIDQKMYFHTTDAAFSFKFNDVSLSYNNTTSCNTDVFEQHSNWGLGSILGFNKTTTLDSTNITDSPVDTSNNNLYFHYNNNQIITDGHFIKSDNKVNLLHNQFIYLEVDKYNTSDEIKPFINDRLNNTNTGLINSYFAKIPIKYKHDDINQSLSCKDDFIDSFSYYQPPIEKISKLKIKFRYHNGLLVDLGNLNISLSIEINQIRNEMKNYDVRTPFRI